jgi:RNA polymerase sigma factor (sigma-70 family)
MIELIVPANGEAWLEACLPKILRYATRIYRSNKMYLEFGDLVNEGILGAMEARARGAATWPRARGAMVDLVRRNWKRIVLTWDLTDFEERHPIDPWWAVRGRIDLERLMGQISERQRAAIVALKIEGRSYREAERAAGVKNDVINGRARRGIERMRQLACLERRKAA